MITSEERKRDIAIICTIISYLNPQELDLIFCTIYSQRCSLAPPVDLSGLGGSSGLLDFDIPQEYLEKFSTSLSFSVSTNRGGLRKMTQLFEGYSDMDELL